MPSLGKEARNQVTFWTYPIKFYFYMGRGDRPLGRASTHLPLNQWLTAFPCLPARSVAQQKGRPFGGPLSKSREGGIDLADCGRVRVGHHDRLVGFDDPCGLRIIHIAAGRDPERRHRDTGDQRHHHDLQVGRTVSRMNGVVHLKPPRRLRSAFCWLRGIDGLCFGRVSWLSQNGFEAAAASRQQGAPIARSPLARDRPYSLPLIVF